KEKAKNTAYLTFISLFFSVIALQSIHGNLGFLENPYSSLVFRRTVRLYSRFSHPPLRSHTLNNKIKVFFLYEFRRTLRNRSVFPSILSKSHVFHTRFGDREFLFFFLSSSVDSKMNIIHGEEGKEAFYTTYMKSVIALMQGS
ncbi:unnamed protein product, partial [Brassica rapa subsp. narinosa]